MNRKIPPETPSATIKPFQKSVKKSLIYYREFVYSRLDFKITYIVSIIATAIIAKHATVHFLSLIYLSP
jgi:hypothetical protein